MSPVVTSGGVSGGLSHEERFRSHVSHAIVHDSAMNIGFFLHSPAVAQVAHEVSLSVQSNASRSVFQKRQTPQALGQLISMAVLFVSHAPTLARAAQSASGRSEQLRSMPVLGTALAVLPRMRPTSERNGPH